MYSGKRQEADPGEIRLCDTHLVTAEEQQRVRDYVCNHPLSRPRVSIIHVILFVLSEAGGVAVGECLIWSVLPCATWIKIVLAVLVPSLIAMSLLKLFCILLVKCYQHYAKESVRRRCLCMPTCSEYALICLYKYPIFKALKKIRRRLLFTCDGGIYKIDQP